MGFSQAKLIEYDMDLTDALILRWFVDFKDTGKMASRIVEEKMYYWVKYDSLLEDVPIIGINNKRTIERRLLKMAESGVLTHITIKEGGTFSFYGIGEKYGELPGGSTEKSVGVGLKSPTGRTQKSEQNINLLKDTSTKYNYKEILDFLNEKTGKTFKAVETNNKLIRARYNEGYTLEDFKAVIDYKASKWKGTEWEKYLRPSTLFSAKNFENYVNEIPNRSIECTKTEPVEEGEFANFLDMVKRGGLEDE